MVGLVSLVLAEARPVLNIRVNSATVVRWGSACNLLVRGAKVIVRVVTAWV